MESIFLERLHNILEAQYIRLKEPLKKHTTFQIGGPADYFTRPQTIRELLQVAALCREFDVRFKIIGNGSNLLFADSGYRGMILKNEVRQEVLFESEESKPGFTKVTASSGMMLSKFVKLLAEHGLAGYEFAAGIPGTIGGALVMNAGAYGGEIGDFVVSVDVLDKTGSVLRLQREDLSFSYRNSIFRTADYIILQAVFLLNHGIKAEITAKITQYNEERKKKQPLEYPSAGSAFKRPDGNYAGKLIMEAGLSGYSAGGAAVSVKHCGFIVNTGGASAEDVITLLSDVKTMVQKHSGYILETEIEILGE